MTPLSATNPRAFAVWFRELERWSVDYFRRVEWAWPPDVIKPIGTVLQQRRIDVSPKLDRVEVPIIEKISFGGVISVTSPDSRKGYKGRLFWAEPGNLIYSKIRVKQGSLAIVPSIIDRLAVSAEYPVYSIDETQVEGAYLELVVRTKFFLRLLEGISHGGSTKTRIPPEEFEKQAIPLPSLPIQRAIVAAWEREQTEIAEMRRQIVKLEEQIETDFLGALGVPTPKQNTLPKAFAVWWAELERWSVMFNQLSTTGVDVHVGRFPVTTLGKVAAVSYGIQKSPLNRPGSHPRPYLRVANVQRGELDLREMKLINVPDGEMPTYRLEYGDLLVCEGNSAELVGRPALWRDEIVDCVHQNHILKVRLDRNQALPEYVLEYMQTLPARIYFRSRAKFTTNLASINSNDLRELLLPLPPLEVQQALVAMIAKDREQIALLRAAVERQVEQSRLDKEAMIRGAKEV